MAKGGIDAQLDRLAALRRDPAAPEAPAELRKALRSRTNLAAAKAADIIAQHRLAGYEQPLVEAFDAFLGQPDKGCAAKRSIAKALVALEARAEAALLLGARHVQKEPVWGGSADVAVELRCVCCAGLVNLRSRHALVPLVHLLADSDAGARSAAVRALAAHGGDAAEGLVRFKMLDGDAEVAVIAECFSAIIELTRSLEPVEPFLQSPDDALRDATALAVGASRLPQAFDLLRRTWDAQVVRGAGGGLLLAIGLTRQPQAVELLLALIADAHPRTAADAIEALALYRGDDAIRARIAAAAQQRGGEALASFHRHFT